MNFRSRIILAALLASGASAEAQIVPTLMSVTDQGGGNFLYTYDAQVVDTTGNGTTVNSGSFFTIYDIYGLVSIPAGPANWTGTQNAIGVNPSGVGPPDSSSVPNVTWDYSGVSINSSGSGPVDLGDFYVISNIGTANNLEGFYGYSALESANGAQLTGASTVSTPIPEPELIGAAAAAMLGLRRRRVQPC